jgi:hypothetical protein
MKDGKDWETYKDEKYSILSENNPQNSDGSINHEKLEKIKKNLKT